jgi:hypothetical protein
MKKCLWLAAFLLTTIFSFNSVAIAEYSFFWFNVGGRAYEDGTYLNRLDLEIIDENEDHITTDIFQSVVLRGPSGETIPLDDLRFVVTPALGWGSNYDGWSGLWTYDGYFDKPYSGYNATLPENQSAGTYTITCTDINGNIMTATKDYTGRMNLPIVPSSSIKTRYDKKGNLSIQWKGIYSGFPYIVDQTMNTSIRVCVWSEQSFWQLTVPAHMNTAFIPSNIVNELKSVGHGHSLYIQFRQATNCNRTYSNAVTLP